MAPYLTRRAFKSALEVLLLFLVLPSCIFHTKIDRGCGLLSCASRIVKRQRHTLVWVCVWLHSTDMHPGTMRILPRLGVGATSCPRWSVALYTSNWKNELFCFFLRQDVNLYYILHLSSCDTCIFNFDSYFDLYICIYFEFMRPSLIVCIILSSHLFLDIMWRKRLYVLQQGQQAYLRCYIYVPLKIKYQVWFFPVVSVFLFLIIMTTIML